MKMNRLILIAALLVFSVFANAQTFNAVYVFSNYTLQPSAVSQITLTPQQANYNYTNALLAPIPMTRVTDGSGQYTYSNLVAGYSYQMRLRVGATDYLFTNNFPVGLTGTTNAGLFTGFWNGQIFCYFTSPNWIYSTNATITYFTNFYNVTNNLSGTNFGVAAGLNTAVTTNGTSFSVNATNQSFLTNGIKAIAYMSTNSFVLTNALPALTNGFVTTSITNGLVGPGITNGFAPTNFVLTSIANSNAALASTNFVKSSTNGLAGTNLLTQYATTNQFVAGTNNIATNAAAQLNSASNVLSSQIIASSNGLNFAIGASNFLLNAKQPASTVLSNLVITGAVTNRPIGGTNVTLSTNILGQLVISATNQTQLTNGMTSIVFRSTNDFVPQSSVSSITNGFVDRSITNGFAGTNFVLSSIASSNASFSTRVQVQASNTAALTITTNNNLAFGLAATNNDYLIGLGATNFSLLVSNSVLTNLHAQILATNFNTLTTMSNLIGNATNSAFIARSNGFGSRLMVTEWLGLGTKTNFLLSTNVIAINGGGDPVQGTYIGAPFSMVWTNWANQTNTILLTGGNYYIQSNGVSLYASANLVAWTVVSGSSPAPIGAVGTVWDLNGVAFNGWPYNTNASASGGTTNFILSGVVTNWTTNTAFSASGSNYILAIAQAAVIAGGGPTNGITASTATNIAASLITVATNSIWAGVTNRGAVQWGATTNPLTSPRPATLFYYISNQIPQYGILTTN